MTNAEKYLKDNVSNFEIAQSLGKYLSKEVAEDDNHIKNLIMTFFIEEATPTLTEDERVILRNLQPEITLIGRNGANELFIAIDSTNEFVDFFCYDHLFQFIKERRRIFNWGTIEERIKWKLQIFGMLFNSLFFAYVFLA